MPLGVLGPPEEGFLKEGDGDLINVVGQAQGSQRGDSPDPAPTPTPSTDLYKAGPPRQEEDMEPQPWSPGTTWPQPNA